jgi:hypothetical protein
MIKVGNFGGRKETKRQAILQKEENYQMVEERWKWQHWNDEKLVDVLRISAYTLLPTGPIRYFYIGEQETSQRETV